MFPAQDKMDRSKSSAPSIRRETATHVYEHGEINNMNIDIQIGGLRIHRRGADSCTHVRGTYWWWPEVVHLTNVGDTRLLHRLVSTV